MCHWVNAKSEAGKTIQLDLITLLQSTMDWGSTVNVIIAYGSL